MSPDKNDICDYICEKLAKECENKSPVIPEDVLEDLGFDSLDKVELGMQFEDDYDIELPDDHVNDLKTVGDIINLISKKVQEKNNV